MIYQTASAEILVLVCSCQVAEYFIWQQEWWASSELLDLPWQGPVWEINVQQPSTTCNSLIYEKRLLTTCVIIYMHSHTRFLTSMDYTGRVCSNSCENGKDIEALRKKWQWWHEPLNFLFADRKYHDEMIVSWWKIIMILYILYWYLFMNGDKKNNHGILFNFIINKALKIPRIILFIQPFFFLETY